MGNVLAAGLGQNLARQVSLAAGLPVTTPAFTVNKVCGSGLKSVQLAAQAIRLGDAEVVVAGGTENMSQAPYLLPDHRWGERLGKGSLVDLLLKDGLTDAFSGDHMGITAEKVAAHYQISREAQDELALNSQLKAAQAQASNRFVEEIVPVTVPQRRGEALIFERDEYPRTGLSLEKMAALKPAFTTAGTVTAANASGINDGAAAVLIMSRAKAEALGLPILVTITSYADAGLDPSIMGCGPIPASQKALSRAGLTVEDLDLIEANEAFAAQALAVNQELGLDPDKVNVNGGAIALGHPIGASGTRVLVTLIHELVKRDGKRGLATLCIGGGMGTAMVVER